MKISHSAKNLYKECSYKYFLHYFRKLRPDENKSAFAFGAAVDNGLNTLLETRDLVLALTEFGSKWNEVPPASLTYSKADLEEHLLTTEEQKLGDIKTKSWISLREKGKIILEEFHAQLLPRIKRVIKVQLDDSIKNESGDELVVKADFICEWEDGRIILFDNKTSSVPYKDDSVQTSDQLGTYLEAFKEEYKVEACGYIVIPKKINKKKKPAIEIKVIIDQVKEEIVEQTFQDFQEVLDGIKDARFDKNWDNCMSKYGKCPYYEYCRTKDTKGLAEKPL